MNDLHLRIYDLWDEDDAPPYEVEFSHEWQDQVDWKMRFRISRGGEMLAQAVVSSGNLSVRTREAHMGLPYLVATLRGMLSKLRFLHHIAEEAVAGVEAPKDEAIRSASLPSGARITNAYVERALASDPEVMEVRRNLKGVEYLISLLEDLVGKEPNTGALEMAHYGYLGRKASERLRASRR